MFAFLNGRTEQGWGGQGGPILPPPVPCNPGSCPFFLGFLPFALFRLRNIMQCCVISPCFSRFPSLWNSHLPPFPLPPPVPLPPPILPGFRPLSPPLTLLEAATQATFYQALFSFRLVKYSAWKGETKNRASYKSSTAEMFCAHFFHWLAFKETTNWNTRMQIFHDGNSKNVLEMLASHTVVFRGVVLPSSHK